MKKLINGPYIKSSNNSNKIMYNILISMIPFVIYRFYLTKMEDIVLLLISMSFTLLTSIIHEIIKNIKDYKFEFKNHLYSLIMSIVIYLFIPYNTPLIVVALSNILSITISKIIKNINPILISGLIINIYFYVVKLKPLYLNMDLLILIIILVISLSYLIIKRAFKFRIALIFISISIFSFILKSFSVSNLYILFILGIYILPELYSSPKSAYACYIYSILCSILYILLPFEYFIVSIIILNIFNKYLDLNIAYFLALKN